VRPGFAGRDGGIPLAHPGAARRSCELCSRRRARGIPQRVTCARRRGDGSLVPYADRGQIETERLDPIVWVRDAVEAFLIQVQGSAQVEFANGRRARLAYDGRNGLPYSSIGGS